MTDLPSLSDRNPVWILSDLTSRHSIFPKQSTCYEWPSPLSPTETFSGVIQIEPQDTYFFPKQSTCYEWPSPLSPTETFSGVIQIEPQDTYFFPKQSTCYEWPSPLSPTETFSGVIQIEPQDTYFFPKQSTCYEWPSPPCLTETFSGLLQIKPHDTLPQVPVCYTLPQVPVCYTLPQVPVCHILPQVPVCYTLLQVPVCYTLPQVPVCYTLPQVPVCRTLPQVPVCYTLPQVPVCYTLPQVPVCYTLLQVPVCYTLPQVPVCHTLPQVPVCCLCKLCVVSILVCVRVYVCACMRVEKSLQTRFWDASSSIAAVSLRLKSSLGQHPPTATDSFSSSFFMVFYIHRNCMVHQGWAEGMDGIRNERPGPPPRSHSSWALTELYSSSVALRPQELHGLLGTGEERDGEWDPRLTSQFTQLWIFLIFFLIQERMITCFWNTDKIDNAFFLFFFSFFSSHCCCDRRANKNRQSSLVCIQFLVTRLWLFEVKNIFWFPPPPPVGGGGRRSCRFSKWCLMVCIPLLITYCIAWTFSWDQVPSLWCKECNLFDYLPCIMKELPQFWIDSCLLARLKHLATSSVVCTHQERILDIVKSSILVQRMKFMNTSIVLHED